MKPTGPDARDMLRFVAHDADLLSDHGLLLACLCVLQRLHDDLGLHINGALKYARENDTFLPVPYIEYGTREARMAAGALLSLDRVRAITSATRTSQDVRDSARSGDEG